MGVRGARNSRLARTIGDHRGAVDWWRQRLARSPEDGRFVRPLMEPLEHAGDRAGALRVATLYASLLRCEFGAETDPDVGLRHGVRAAQSAHH